MGSRSDYCQNLHIRSFRRMNAAAERIDLVVTQWRKYPLFRREWDQLGSAGIGWEDQSVRDLQPLKHVIPSLSEEQICCLDPQGDPCRELLMFEIQQVLMRVSLKQYYYM